MTTIETNVFEKVTEYKEDIKKCVEGNVLVNKAKLLELLHHLESVEVSHSLLEVSFNFDRCWKSDCEMILY
jgi:hypothetical protein